MSEPMVDAPHLPVEPVASGARTLGEVLRRRARATPDAAASFDKRDGEWRRFSWRDFHDDAARVARGLAELGLEAGERISILGPTRYPWTVYDLGGQLAGLVTVGIYPSQSAEQLRYLLEHSDTRVVFVDGEDELTTLLEAAAGNDGLVAVVPWEEELAERFAERDPRIVPPSRFGGEPMAEAEIDRRLDAVDPDELAILIYTSGTTGPPKGAMITHANLLSLFDAVQDEIFRFYQDDLLLSFLPLAHATERNLAFYCRISNGVAAAYASSIGAVLTEVREVRPTIFGSVPRMFEKAYAKVRSELARKPAPVRRLFEWAVAVGRERARCQIAWRPVPAFLRLRDRIAHRLVFRKVHAAFGGRVRACITGAAPISGEILDFFWAVGMPIYEAYGMTEATVVSHINRDGAIRLGTVGKVIPPLEHRVADDGEVLLRGPFVFAGYFKNPEATAETLRDGWLYSGDVGEIDGDGFLRITDRKKHLIITAGGKNVAPANVERAIKSQSPLISQIHAHGDRRPYVSALVAPSPLETLEWGREHGILGPEAVTELSAELMANPAARSEALGRAMAAVVADRRFRELFVEPARRGNRELARVERVRRIAILDRDFSQEGGEMTPTMKMKRKAIEEKYADLFDRIYEDPDFGLEVEAAAG